MIINVIDDAGNVQVRTTTAALETLGLRPFSAHRLLTARGTLVNPTGAGWAWLCPFGGDQVKAQAALFADLCDIEAAEKEAPKRKRA